MRLQSLPSLYALNGRERHYRNDFRSFTLKVLSPSFPFYLFYETSSFIRVSSLNLQNQTFFFSWNHFFPFKCISFLVLHFFSGSLCRWNVEGDTGVFLSQNCSPYLTGDVALALEKELNVIQCHLFPVTFNIFAVLWGRYLIFRSAWELLSSWLALNVKSNYSQS